MYSLRKNSEEVLICDGARVVGDVELGKGVSVWYNAVIRGDNGAVFIGADTNVQDCAVIHNPTTIGRGCTIGHSAIVHGAQVGDNVLIGMHATLLNGAVIGEGSIIGAGALVREGQVIPPRSVVVGMPAKVIKEATDAQVAGNIENARHYIELGKRYKG